MAAKRLTRRKLDPPHSELSIDSSDNSLFLEAMSDVAPLERTRVVPRANGVRRKAFKRDTRQEDGLLRDFVAGKQAFDWTLHPAYHQGGPESANRRLLRRLHNGAFSVQAQLDLHGMTQQEALQRLEEFLHSCLRRGFRCVRIIHGKGKNSSAGRPVLKRQLPRWLSMRRISQFVVAFTSAPPNDGGVGATYVLLRSRAKRKKLT
jgi:DNA-nicking Smr family endonuclease